MSSIWDGFKNFCLCALTAAALLGAVYLVAEVACFAGAKGISRATRDDLGQSQVTYHIPPIVVKLVKPDGETLEATAVLEGASQETEQQQ